MEDNKKENFEVNTQSDSYIDIKEIGELRKDGKYDVVYKMLKEKHNKHPKNAYIITQLLIATIDYKPDALDEIHMLATACMMKKKKLYGYYGFTMYHLALGNLEKAKDCYSHIKQDKFYRDKANINFRRYERGVEFRKMLFNIEEALEEFNAGNLEIRRYIFLTSDIADYYYDNEDYEKAIYYYELSNSKRNEKYKSSCYFKLGKCYAKLKNFDKADEAFKKSIDIAKQNYLDNLKEEKENKEKSIGSRKLKKNKEYKFEYLKNVYEYVIFLINFNELEEAEKHIPTLETGSDKDKNMAKFAKAKVLNQKEKYADAIKLLEELLGGNPVDRKTSLYELVKIYTKLDNKEETKKYLDILNNEYGMNLGITLTFYYDFEDYDELIRCATPYLETEDAIEAKYYIGKAYSRQGRIIEAEKMLEEIKEDKKIKSKSSILFELALVKEKLGKYEEAFNYYMSYINSKTKTHDKVGANKGFRHLIDFLINQFKFEEALQYIEIYKSINGEVDTTNLLYAKYYYRKQDYETALIYLKKLYGTKFENFAKNYEVIILRYSGRGKDAEPLLEELENTEYSNEVVLNRSKLQKDEHTIKSLNDALTGLMKVKDSKIQNMVISEELDILIKLKSYRKAMKVLDEAYQNFVFTLSEYYRYKSYILLKQGLVDAIREEDRDIFINYSISYDPVSAINSILIMNETNQNMRPLFLSDSEVTNLYYDLLNTLDNYDYYMSGLYDIYVIDMGKVVGQFHGLDTQLLEIKCEQNTTNIHVIQPTLKRVNVNKYGDYSRKKTDF